MNYRHAFHAGNFADLVKHAGLTVLLDLFTRNGSPLTVVDTHAGAGAYDLAAEASRRTGEAIRGVEVLIGAGDAPEGFDILTAAVSRMNPGGGVRVYPGSPLLEAAALGPDDRLIACELHPDDHAALAGLMNGDARITVLNTDGYAEAPRRASSSGRVLIHIDPPFERADDYARAAGAAAAVLARNRDAVILIWTPLKDLETFDGFLRRLEAGVDRPVLIAETRLRPLSDPMRLNGCALVVINPPDGLSGPLGEVCLWTAQRLGETGHDARIWEF